MTTSSSDHADKPVSKVVFGLMALGLVLRIAFALACQNINHPDEIFQYLEPAHRLVFGYGFITWEYRFGTRSWLIPFVVSVPLFICRALGIDDPAIYVPLVKCMFCLFSLSLIFSSYIVIRNLVSEKAGIVAAVLSTFWYELIYFSFRPLSDIISTYFLVGGLAFLVDRGKRGRPILFAICVALAALIRTQYIPALIFLVVVSAYIWSRREFLKSAAVLVLVILLGGFLDYLTWGGFFASVYNCILFNGIYNVGRLFTPAKPPLWFIEATMITSMGVLPILLLVSFFYARRLWLLITCASIILLTHSLMPTKEYRYIFADIPILLMIAAAVIDTLIRSKLPASNIRIGYFYSYIVLLFVSIAGCQSWLPNETMIYQHSPLYDRQIGIESSNFLSREKDLSGVLIDNRLWWMSGGYYHLHQPIPMYRPQIDFSDWTEADPFISHMLHPAQRVCPGYKVIANFNQFAVGKKLKAQYETLPGWSYHLLQPGIDDRYQPTVRPFLSK